MSAVLKTFEGSWDDVLRHAPELAGHRVLVTVLDQAPLPHDHPGFDTSPAAVAQWVARLRQRALHRPPMRLGDDSRDAAYEDLLK